MQTKIYPTTVWELLHHLHFYPNLYCHHSYEPFCGRRFYFGHEGEDRIIFKNARGEAVFLDLVNVFDADGNGPRIVWEVEGFTVFFGRTEVRYEYLGN